ncbi:protein-L-isoaspartate(D-aspartate) O-methyltransferase [Porticoccus sp. W117]|uniref:protein-L-isoaspartate(D-aspartate) O-methyltransferase n=1 Tax=Porticoccus sp. W117 TaxID=3054777 RepID=UPI00259140BA|nr:protein-L-isoaspartate(D-aspartate) O-methyltransferase [Porticoccus sp. W117]MDM3870291.1 protein-L-isoaspartate(D-aspartate) O-methyltransferase [Porticoccus sp. W117]
MTSQRTRERLIQRLVEQGVTSQQVLDVIRTTPRHLFLDEALSHRAYEDTALPIGHKQTLSQPYIVARMTELLLSRGPLDKVLEIGTGSGYQTAVLAQLVNKVYTVERIRPLLNRSRDLLRRLGYRNVSAALSDGGFGWPDYAPYNGIISTAAPQSLPEELLHQLAPDGILIIPIGPDGEQELRMIIREGDSNNFSEEVIEPVRFVPLLSGLSR